MTMCTVYTINIQLVSNLINTIIINCYSIYDSVPSINCFNNCITYGVKVYYK